MYGSTHGCDNVGRTSKFSRFSQLLACSATNLILFGNGLVLSFPTIVIAALLNKPGPLSFNADQASWFASISLISQPIGSLFGGLVMEPLGRKISMLLLNIPFISGWLLVYFAENIDVLYLAAAILGFSLGCTRTPILTYVGEISEPKYRGTLASCGQLFGSFAYFVVYLMGSLTSWRTTAIFCACVPVATLLAGSMIPESPLWLISRGRINHAQSALCWLRGWVKPDAVTEELQSLILYHKQMTTGLSLKKPPQDESPEELIGINEMSLRQKFSYFMRPQMMKPLFLIVSYFFFSYASGFQTIRPYLVPVSHNIEMDMNADYAIVIIAIVGVLGNAACMVSVKKLGKRPITLISLGGCAVCNFSLAGVAGKILPLQWSLWLMLVFSFVSSIGVSSIPWMLQSELYPFQGKCLAAGVAAAASYVIGFVATKTYLSLENFLHLEGVFVLFGVMSIVGYIHLHARLPETEGRSFDEIAAEFDGDKRNAKQ